MKAVSHERFCLTSCPTLASSWLWVAALSHKKVTTDLCFLKSQRASILSAVLKVVILQRKGFLISERKPQWPLTMKKPKLSWRAQVEGAGLERLFGSIPLTHPSVSAAATYSEGAFTSHARTMNCFQPRPHRWQSGNKADTLQKHHECVASSGNSEMCDNVTLLLLQGVSGKIITVIVFGVAF